MATAKLIIERSTLDNTNTKTAGSRLKAYLDQASIPTDDINVFVYEVFSFGAGNISIFIGTASPSDMLNLVVGEPITPIVGTRFRMDTVDIIFRSEIHTEKVVVELTKDLSDYFRLKTDLAAVPGGPYQVVIT